MIDPATLTVLQREGWTCLLCDALIDLNFAHRAGIVEGHYVYVCWGHLLPVPLYPLLDSDSARRPASAPAGARHQARAS
jgi:hypothetical protein